jgi:methyltransferase (TIGR00027 family)
MPLIRNVSDTARWVAMYRAIESGRPDALFHDPWAEKLAGERGREILDGLPDGRSWGWPMVVRTAVMDEIIQREVAAGIDTVVHLAAGMDMRPFRMKLPASLRWVEIDLPEILDEKVAAVGGEAPNCVLERIAADLADEGARRGALARATTGAKRALVVSEGLLIYLGEAQVAALATDLAALPAAALWLLDIAHPKLLHWLSRRWGSVVAEGGAPFRFAPEANTAFFAPYGWQELEYRGAMAEAERLHRMMPGAWFYKVMRVFMPPKTRAMYRRFSGYALLERSPFDGRAHTEAR